MNKEKIMQLKRVAKYDFMFSGVEDKLETRTTRLFFSNNRILELDLIPDGESVKFEWITQEEYARREQDTDWSEINISTRNSISNLIGKCISYIRPLHLVNEDVDNYIVSGFGVFFENGHYLTYYNDGDVGKYIINSLPDLGIHSRSLEWSKKIEVK